METSWTEMLGYCFESLASWRKNPSPHVNNIPFHITHVKYFPYLLTHIAVVSIESSQTVTFFIFPETPLVFYRLAVKTLTLVYFLHTICHLTLLITYVFFKWANFIFSRACFLTSKATYLLTMVCACVFVGLCACGQEVTSSRILQWYPLVVSLETPLKLKMRLTGSDITLGIPQKDTTEGDTTGIAWRYHINWQWGYMTKKAQNNHMNAKKQAD